MVSGSLGDSQEIMKPNCPGIHFLRTLFCSKEKVNPSVFKQFRTLCQKTRGRVPLSRVVRCPLYL